MRILSWNLLKHAGAGVAEIGRLIERHRPDLLLMQEATARIDALPGAVGGGCYVREPMAGRDNGLAAWSPHPFDAVTMKLPAATRLDLPVPVFRSVAPRLALMVRARGLLVANVHLDHGQWANRRQLRQLLQGRPLPDLVIGDTNALGRTRLPGFDDVGPRRTTHHAYGIVPLRLDRCLARGLRPSAVGVLGFGRSDHRPILLEFATTGGEPS